MEILDEIINRPEFRHWEIDDAHARLEFDLDVYDEQPETSMTAVQRFSLRYFEQVAKTLWTLLVKESLI